MSLSARERYVLDSIRTSLADSYPDLAGIMATFTALTDGEAMPAREQVRLSRRWAVGPRRRGGMRRRARRGRPHAWLAQVLMLLWLLVTAASIAVGVALGSSTSDGTAPCNVLAAMSCAQQARAHSTRLDAHEPAPATGGGTREPPQGAS
jgi:hypothetical protein